MKGSIGRQTRYHSLFYGVKGYNKNSMKILRSIYISSKEDIISFRLVLNFHSLYGTKATMQTYGISKATIYRWKKRKREVSKEVEEFIISYREGYPGVGKETIKYALDNFCDLKGIKKISVSTIGRIIKDLKEKGKIMDIKKKLSLDARTGKLYERKKKKHRKKLRLKGYKPTNAGDLVQIDSISIFKNGIKRYIITAVDVFTRFSFAYVYKNLSSLSAKDFMEKFKSVAPFEIKSVQTDNGKEFEKYLKRIA